MLLAQGPEHHTNSLPTSALAAGRGGTQSTRKVCMTTRNTLCAWVFCLVAPAAWAAPVVDQANTSPIGSSESAFGVHAMGGPIYVMQSFTVGSAGQLTSVDFFLSRNNSTADVLLEIVSIADPSGTALASFSRAAADMSNRNAEFVNFNLDAADLFVASGEQYWIRLSSAQPMASTYFGAPSNYNGGHPMAGGYAGGEGRQGMASALNVYGQDYYFRTYVDADAVAPAASVPEPGTLLLAGMAGLALMATRRRRH